jgi:hypothetical protein
LKAEGRKRISLTLNTRPGTLNQLLLSASALDLCRAGASVVSVPEEQRTRGASRYETIIATLVGVCALAVAGYTAYMQRQQVRAAVWPILQCDSSNDPDIHFTLSNKGVGPAIIRHVVVTVDGQPVRNWAEVLEKILGPGTHAYSESDMSGRVLSAGESMTIFTPRDAENKPIAYDRSNPLYVQMNKDRLRVAVEICYCSTLGECWTLRSDAKSNTSTTETRRCPSSSTTSFQQ